MVSAVIGPVKLGAYERASLFLIRTVTPLHIGIGRVIGVVDLPIIRDALGFPVIPTSSLKGALRTQFSETPDVKVLFGPEPGEEAYAGALAVTEGHLLAMPVRSLRGIWVLVTSPLLIRRFVRMLQMMQYLEPIGEFEEFARGLLNESEGLEVDGALICKEGEEKFSFEIMGKRQILINEEFQFECKQSERVREFFEKIRVPEAWRVILLHDDRVKDVIERSILRRARIRLKKEKVVESGGLWSEEDLPTDTLFFNILLYSKSRSPENSKNVEEVRRKVLKGLLTDYEHGRGYTIFGGHETIGRGIVEFIGLAGCSL
jgi:CRISPR-associated protein Cmr4